MNNKYIILNEIKISKSHFKFCRRDIYEIEILNMKKAIRNLQYSDLITIFSYSIRNIRFYYQYLQYVGCYTQKYKFSIYSGSVMYFKNPIFFPFLHYF